MGLVSLQSLLLLLEVGRSRKEKGLPFILALDARRATGGRGR
jgi:hypothetical protein